MQEKHNIDVKKVEEKFKHLLKVQENFNDSLKLDKQVL